MPFHLQTLPQVVYLAYHAALDPRVGAYARQLGELGAALSGVQLQAVTRLGIAEAVDQHMGEVREMDDVAVRCAWM